MSMRSSSLALPSAVACLALLSLMDSFKLVRRRRRRCCARAGAVVALAAVSALHDASARSHAASHRDAFSRYVAPLTEESAKAAVHRRPAVARRRVGFLVDAAVLGFAVGAGFALVENIDYLRASRTTRRWLWLVRGLGTAILHGATTAMFAMLSQDAGRSASRTARLASFLPGWLAAVASIRCSTTCCCRRSR